MQAFCFEPALTVSGELPLQRAGLRIKCVKLSVVTADVNRAVRNCRRSGYRSVCRSLPNLTTGRGVNCVHISVVSAEVDHVIFENRRRNHAIAGWKFPFHAMELPRRRSLVRSGMHSIAAKHWFGINRRSYEKATQQP